MVKIKAISRDSRDFTKGSSSEMAKVHRSMQPELHPYQKSREYVRALNAVKLDKHFSKPFVGALSGHMDGVNCLAKSPSALTTLVSGGCDGEVIRWDLTDRQALWRVQAHSGFVRGVSFSRAGHHFVSASDDKTVKLWSASAAADDVTPLATFLGRHAFTDVDHHRKEHSFATGGPTLLIWDTSRSEPVQSFEWGVDSITRVRFNIAQPNLLGALASDRSVTLFDLRTGSAMQKAVMQTRGNALCWNPMEPFHFTLASEDHALYTFDMRKLDHAIQVHHDHVSAVLDVDYSPTGKQFVSASYDKTVCIWSVDLELRGHHHHFLTDQWPPIYLSLTTDQVRIWSVGEPRSEAVYHTKRMQRLFCTAWSMDGTACHLPSCHLPSCHLPTCWLPSPPPQRSRHAHSSRRARAHLQTRTSLLARTIPTCEYGARRRMRVPLSLRHVRRRSASTRMRSWNSSSICPRVSQG